MVPASFGSVTKVADAAKSMNSSSTIICMGANGSVLYTGLYFLKPIFYLLCKTL